MSEQDQDKKRPEQGIIYAPWERTFTRVLTPFEEFIHRQTTSGLLLMGTAIIALLLANSFVAEAYQHFIHTPTSINIGSWGISMSLHHFVNDGLMALFFFVVGMELKREMLVGELSDLRQAALPIIAAIGGMVMPALIFLAFNPGGDAARGWGIPMATDIAFAVGALVLLASRVPKALITFLVALAIADDLGAVLVIALFYTQQLALDWLAGSGALVLLLFVLNFAGIRKVMPYFLLAVLLWYALLQSGVHATLAGVLGAFAVPARPKYDPALFSIRIKALMARFDSSNQEGGNIMANEELYTVVQNLEKNVRGVQTPLQRLEHVWHLPVAFLVIPVFALFNAGIPLQFGALGETFSHPVMLGVLLGLLLGKFIGITGACWVALRLGIGQLPSGTRFSQIAAVSVLGGIGFTMSIFIAELGFAAQPEYLLMAKTGVLAASLLAGVLGFVWLWWLGSAQVQVAQEK
ncbi:MAG: Na+/H+ antiporter NhaA [Gallionellales bacterium 35-53-114]|jgi:NhaA family Na+:H+ antiporter|nr:MAG: Na+/H+ antiporter NhaA [Gallionellales bacterium 35-53-114]OYZ63245.1 MAG: Na+/H+ antiporter NhaA [Gallionellales bacterium 24-53-125]OZB08710.1 MAG: Na+/H+ antiporter NhaA [Gallionellales bacterium 39-52-133]HQS57424.1 Na+/H+ antiporter NhaA [Gallionellaceae bacterium]HQS74388.1 Na+/H+ antiporter NhaA [Gallionellaceae bacterium]